MSKPKTIKYITVKAQEKDGKKVAVIDIFGLIGQGFFEEGNTMEGLKAEIKKADPSKIIVNIASLGGSAFEGLAIHDLIKSQKVDTEVNIVGATASAAAIIAQSGDTRKISENALFLVHNSHGMAFGGVEQMERAASDMKLINKKMSALLTKSAGDKSTLEEVEALMKEDKFISAEEAEEFGFVDEVLEASDIAASKLDWDAIAQSKELNDEQKLALIKKYKSDEGDEGEEAKPEGEGEGSGEGEEAKPEGEEAKPEGEPETKPEGEEAKPEGEEEEEAKPEGEEKEAKEYTQYDSFVAFMKKHNPFGAKNTNDKSDNGDPGDEHKDDKDKEIEKLKAEKVAEAKRVEDLESQIRKGKQKKAKASGNSDADDPDSPHADDFRSDQIKGWDKNAEVLREAKI